MFLDDALADQTCIDVITVMRDRGGQLMHPLQARGRVTLHCRQIRAQIGKLHAIVCRASDFRIGRVNTVARNYVAGLTYTCYLHRFLFHLSTRRRGVVGNKATEGLGILLGVQLRGGHSEPAIE